MRKFFTLSIFLALIVQLGFSQSFSKNTGAIDGQLMVRFGENIDPQAFIDQYTTGVNAYFGLSILETISKRFNIYLLGFDESVIDKFSILSDLEKQKEVRYGELDYYLEFRDSVPNDPLFDSQWDMKIIQAPEVWSLTIGGETALGDEIVVAVLDKGFDLNHPDLRNHIWENLGEIPNNDWDDDLNGRRDDINGWNFKNNTPFHPEENHGTNVSGIIGAEGNNDEGIAGINWNVKIMPLTVATSSQIAAGYMYAYEMRDKYNKTNGVQGAFVVATNASLGFDKQFCDEHPIWRDAYDLMGQAGILNTAATANADWDVDIEGDMPTTCESDFLISVTNTNMEDEKEEEAAYGSISIDLGAPGKPTTTTSIFSQYRDNFNGTSSASPHVAGAIALLYSVPCIDFAQLVLDNPIEAALLVKDAILNGTDPIPSLNGKTVTGGRLNLYKAMRYLHGYCIANSEERASNTFDNIYLGSQGFVRIYPNPVGNLLTLDYSTKDFGEFEIQIFNSLGQLIYRQVINSAPFSEQTIEIDAVQSWPAGSYYINVVNQNEKITDKFIKGKF
ncbi:MAG: S8 family peptidase [Bacteroidetes bacterium]|nr:S8 family peptidase [Bacteroidota bacterium]